MNKQPEALRLAECLDDGHCSLRNALHPAASELRRLHSVEKEFQQWITKTEWVQKSSQSHELGMHRADVMKQRLEQILIENQQLRAALSQPQGEQEPVAWMVTSEMQDGTRSTYPMIGRFKDVQDCCDFGEPVPLIYQHQ